jgi:hypothetical protein
MSDDLRARMRAVFAGKFTNSGKGALQRYKVDFAKESLRYSEPSVTQDLSNQIKTVTRARTFSANRDCQKEDTCAVCHAAGDLWHSGEVLVHQECASRLPKPEAAEPTMAYRATSIGPDGVGCKVEIVELPQAGRYRKVFGILQLKPPALVEVARWRQCVEDGKRFLAKWGEAAQALNWSSADLFGLHEIPAKPHPSYRRLSRYDCTGLIWLLEGRPVVALTADTAVTENPTGNITTYRRFNKPALGPMAIAWTISNEGSRLK